MAEPKKVFRYKLDFLYQSIAVYAVTLIAYLVVRGLLVNREFPIIWRDPILYLLSIITLISAISLAYNILMKRRIIIEGDVLRFVSAAKERVIKREEVLSLHVGREIRTKAGKRPWIVKIRRSTSRRPARIRLFNFEHSGKLLQSLEEWAGPAKVHEAPHLRKRGPLGGHAA